MFVQQGALSETTLAWLMCAVRGWRSMPEDSKPQLLGQLRWAIRHKDHVPAAEIETVPGPAAPPPAFPEQPMDPVQALFSSHIQFEAGERPLKECLL